MCRKKAGRKSGFFFFRLNFLERKWTDYLNLYFQILSIAMSINRRNKNPRQAGGFVEEYAGSLPVIS